jgi:hypothetical protein
MLVSLLAYPPAGHDVRAATGGESRPFEDF